MRFWFQSTLPHGERHAVFVVAVYFCVFQSTLPHGERLIPEQVAEAVLQFQSTLPHGERRRKPNEKPWGSSGFNPRSHMGSDTPRACSMVTAARFQSTLPHGERHYIEQLAQDGWRVSIHAPTWGATFAFSRFSEFYTFQSTLPHGERRPQMAVSALLVGFNPRSHMGSDIGLPLVSRNGIRVSIHAPTWGATFSQALLAWASAFQSTLPHGERLAIVGVLVITFQFQSTLPHGERHGGSISHITPTLVSIHAPTWGATRQFPQVPSVCWFQSTLPHGERPYTLYKSLLQ